MIASSVCLVSSISVGCFIVLIYMTRIERLDHEIKTLKASAPSETGKDTSSEDIPVAGKSSRSYSSKSTLLHASY